MKRERIWVAVVAAALTLAVGAQGASAATFSATCSTLENYLDGTNTVNSGDVVKLSGICANKSFEITNTNAFTLEGVGNQSNGTPSSGFTGIDNSGNGILDSGSAVRLTIKNLLFENATKASGGGTAITFTDNDAIAVTITGNTFENLIAPTYGGAISIEDSTDGNGVSTPTVISHNTFKDNSAADGGAIYWSDGSPLQLTDNTFTGNAQTSDSTSYPVGGAVDIENYEGSTSCTKAPCQGWLGSPITISGNTFGGTASGAGNTALGAGGALFISVQGGEASYEPAQTVTLSANKFIDNEVTGGADFDLYGGALGMAPQVREYAFKVVQSGNLFQGNKIVATAASGYGVGGGAEWGIALPIKSTKDVFIGNEVNATTSGPVPPPLGGALGIISTNQYIGASTSTTLLTASFTGADDLFLDNSNPSTSGWGGALYSGGVTTLYCPTATSCPSRLTLSDSTITGNSVNSSTGEGAAIWGGSTDSLALHNSIVFGNTGVSGAPEIFGYSKPSYSHDDACTVAGGSTPLSGAGDICANPKLTSLGVETAASPTIDRGLNSLVPAGLTTDVGGRPRISTGRVASCPRAVVDMGAFESLGVSCNVVAPKITGTALPGHRLSCSTGAWTNHPTHFLVVWSRNGKQVATGQTYRVKDADANQTLTCSVTAFNVAGRGATARSRGVLVKLACPLPSGVLNGTKLGPLSLGMTLAQAERILPFKNRINAFYNLCMSRTGGERVGIPTQKLLSTLSSSERKRVAGKVVLLSSGSTFYALQGVKPGTKLSKVAAKLHVGPALHIGVNDWYFCPNGPSNGVLKVRNGVILEIGVADKQLSSGTKQQQFKFMNSFS